MTVGDRGVINSTGRALAPALVTLMSQKEHVGMETFDLHELILCVSEVQLGKLLCSHTVDRGTFDLHGLI